MQVPLPSRLATGELAWASVAAFVRAAGIRGRLDPARIALAYHSERLFTLDGSIPEVWSPCSGFWRTADGWVRTHGNYPHHARRMLAGLGILHHPQQLAPTLSALSSSDAVSAITRAGGFAVEVLPERPSHDADLRAHPLVEVSPCGSPEPSAPSTPVDLTDVRILDLTRVIAGPVCTRSLALLGADVLRIDPPQLPELEVQHLDTGHGKRSAVLDARSPRFTELLAAADVVVLGYRPASIARLGLSPEVLLAEYPGIVVAQLSAWGVAASERAGFDSLVQAESGIALVESPDGDRPGALPAQALDHSAGYLLAASVLSLLQRRREKGVGGIARTSLRRVAAELLGMPRRESPEAVGELDPLAHTAKFEVDGHVLTTARPVVPGYEFQAPRPWGADQPRW
ncbi:MAG: CoA transferase [Microbacterium sp.]